MVVTFEERDFSACHGWQVLAARVVRPCQIRSDDVRVMLGAGNVGEQVVVTQLGAKAKGALLLR